ncbi:MAG: sulfatase-like hydrolase/transferase [Planctomycetota bacterium]
MAGHSLFLLAFWVLTLCAYTPVAASEPPRPNIIHIFADDIGKGSIGILHQNARADAGLPAIKTPNLDSLAAAGMNFENAYSATVCSPSRAMLYAGFNQAHTNNDRNWVRYGADDVSLGTVMQEAGYTTSVFGKWGFGGGAGTATSPQKEFDLQRDPVINNFGALPTNHGYDEFTGFLSHPRAHRYFASSLWTTDTTGNPVTQGLSEQFLGNIGAGNTNLQSTYTHDVIAQRSEKFVEDHYQDADPFFMQVNYTIVHDDLDAIQYVPGWFDDYSAVDTSSWSVRDKYYAAMITRMDTSIGSLMAKLENPDGDPNTDDSILDNTMIVFTSDNGAGEFDYSIAGLQHFGLINSVDGGYLRGGKKDLWEGGIQMPQFVRWDGVVEAGSTTDHKTDLTDFMATVADLAGVQAPVGIDGHSLAPLLTGDGVQRHRDYLIFEHHEADGPDPDNLDARWAIIRGDHKLIKFSNGLQRLYDLANDPQERNELDLNLPANAALANELSTIALAEGVEQPSDYDYQHATWSGGDGDSLNVAGNWNLGATPQPTWSTVVNNTSGIDAVATAVADVETLGFEIQGDSGRQTVRVDRTMSLLGRNAIRIDAGGRLQLDDASIGSWRWTDVMAGAELTGHGTIQGDVYNVGTIEPGKPTDLPTVPPVSAVSEVTLDSTGTLQIDGDFWHLPDGLIALELAGTDNSDPLDPEFDTLTVSGIANIEGDLLITLDDGFSPELDDVFDLLDFASSSGSFGSIGLPSLAPGLAWDTSRLLADGSIQVVASPDFNFDGSIDGADFLAWQRGSSPSPFSAADLANWQNAYSAVGTVASVQIVPEPGGLGMILLGLQMGVPHVFRRY